MGNLKGTQINKIDGGLGRQADSNDSAILLVGSFPLGDSTIAVGTAVKLIQVKDAEDLGINESFDANNKVLAHYHISETFRLAPEATVYLLNVAADSTISAATSSVIKAVKENPEIKGIGYFGFKEGLTAVSALVDELQSTLINELKKDGILIDFVLLEAGKADAAATINTYPDLRAKAAENISVIIGQDNRIAGLDAAYANHAAIGSALGMLCVRQVSENIGSVDILNKPDDKKGSPVYSLTDSGLKRFVSASLSTGQKISDLTNEQIQSLVTKGYILVGGYIGAAGLYFSGSATCTAKKSDYAYIENNRVWNKAARLIREVLAPQIKGKVKKDPQTGYIASTTISHWERLCAKGCIERMESDNDISGGEVSISAKQAPTEDNPLKIGVTVVADDIVHSFTVDLSLTNKL
ncbi:hypothetical protein ATE49_04370 [Elizabethkingia miricola]|uniref:DUF2586 family protein n=1 Tax=Elizabethkingia miricola TaxID=172045 RepID=A0ABY3NAR4_ELIMR|nr:DUF2586 family protein [Elizabethkingia miricola]OBS12722.1 hypothetical protein ATE49_04370 [Elizabethkingia miricola]TYO84546.1 hypothetical protein LX74_03970 [Elizabethkingia miricola]